MEKKDFPYSHIQHFQTDGDSQAVIQKVKNFIECGWLYVGLVSIAGSLFECVVWERSKGEPIYPENH